MRNKLLLTTLLVFFFNSCKQKEYFHTEMFCPQLGFKVLIRFAEAKEVDFAIRKFLQKKINLKTQEDYTVISLPGNRSFALKKVPPEEAVKCQLFQVKAIVTEVEKKAYY